MLYSVSVQQIAGFERKFAGDLNDRDAAVDGINIHDTNGSGSGSHLVDEIFVGGSDQDGGVIGVRVIGSNDETVEVTLGHAVDLFENQFHFRGRRGAHDKGDGLAVWPVVGLGFADFHQLGKR